MASNIIKSLSKHVCFTKDKVFIENWFKLGIKNNMGRIKDSKSNG
jgi:hypothetical protein